MFRTGKVIEDESGVPEAACADERSLNVLAKRTADPHAHLNESFMIALPP